MDDLVVDYLVPMALRKGQVSEMSKVDLGIVCNLFKDFQEQLRLQVLEGLSPVVHHLRQQEASHPGQSTGEDPLPSNQVDVHVLGHEHVDQLEVEILHRVNGQGIERPQVRTLLLDQLHQAYQLLEVLRTMNVVEQFK